MRLDWEGSKVCRTARNECAASARVAAGRLAPGDRWSVRCSSTLPAFCTEVCNFAQTVSAAPKDNEGPLSRTS
jgi:hypothetical protein